MKSARTILKALLVKRSLCLLSVGFLSACGSMIKPETAPDINAGLDYLWQEHGGAHEVAVRPGMKLVVHSLPLRPERLNDTIPAPTSYEWIVPAPNSNLSREDVLFANFLAVSGIPKKTTHKSVEEHLQERAEELCPSGECRDGVVAPQFVDEILTPLFSTLRVRSFHRWGSNSGDAFTTTAIRRSVCEPSAEILRNSWEKNDAVTGGLLFSYSVDAESRDYQVLGAEDWFFRGGRLDVNSRRNGSNWYPQTGDVDKNRGFTEIKIPIRVSREPTSIYFPVCYSVADAEKRLGQEIIGLRRNSVFFPRDSEGNPKIKARVRDGYFTIWFNDRVTLEDAMGPPELKSHLVMGAGDVLILSRKRFVASDSPTPIWP